MNHNTADVTRHIVRERWRWLHFYFFTSRQLLMPLANVVSVPLLQQLLACSWTCAITILKIQNVSALTAGRKYVFLVSLEGGGLRYFLPHPSLLWVTINSYEQCGISDFRDRSGVGIFETLLFFWRTGSLIWVKKQFLFSTLLESTKSVCVWSDCSHFRKEGWLCCVVLLFASAHLSSWIPFCCWQHDLPFLR